MQRALHWSAFIQELSKVEAGGSICDATGMGTRPMVTGVGPVAVIAQASTLSQNN